MLSALRARQDHVSVVLVRECALVPVSHRSALRALDLPGGSIALIYSKSIHPRLEDTALGCTPKRDTKSNIQRKI